MMDRPPSLGSSCNRIIRLPLKCRRRKVNPLDSQHNNNRTALHLHCATHPLLNGGIRSWTIAGLCCRRNVSHSLNGQGMRRGRKEPIELDRQSNCLAVHLGQIRSQMFALLSGGPGQSDHLFSCRICEHLRHLLQDQCAAPLRSDLCPWPAGSSFGPLRMKMSG